MMSGILNPSAPTPRQLRDIGRDAPRLVSGQPAG